MEKKRKINWKTNKPIENEVLKKQIGVRLTIKEYKELKKISKDLDVPLARLMRNITIVGIRETKALYKLKLLKGAKQLKDFEKAFKEIFFNIKENNLLNQQENNHSYNYCTNILTTLKATN